MTVDLASVGLDDLLAREYRRRSVRDLRGQTLRPARVARVDHGVCVLLSASGTERASLGGQLLARGGADLASLPCVGDWVLLRAWPDRRTTVEEVLPRRSLIRSGQRAFVANLDILALVMRSDAPPDLTSPPRLAARAQAAGCMSLVLPADVSTGSTRASRPGRLPGQLDPSDLRERLAGGQTLCLVGPARSGKSAIVHRLAGAPVLGVPRNRGSATGTAANVLLTPLASGGCVIDTPGASGLAAAGLDATRAGDSFVRPAPARHR
jgi:ribosome biogenesis GTPase